MMNNIKVYCVGSDYIANWIDDKQIVKTIDEADAVVFPGGSDWNPHLYEDFIGRQTYSYTDIDIFQLKALIEAYHKNKFLIGICRGAQLLGIANGGKLIQHVTNHCRGDHQINIIGQKIIHYTNSIHHQMVNWNSLVSHENYKNVLLGWADNISSTYLSGTDVETTIRDVNDDIVALKHTSYREPEIFYLGLIKGFGIQGHPEGAMPQKTIEFLNRYIKILLKRGLSSVNMQHPAIDKRFDLFAKVYPELSSVLTKARAERFISKPATNLLPAELPLIQSQLPIKPSPIAIDEKNWNSNNQVRVWSDEPISGL